MRTSMFAFIMSITKSGHLLLHLSINLAFINFFPIFGWPRELFGRVWPLHPSQSSLLKLGTIPCTMPGPFLPCFFLEPGKFNAPLNGCCSTPKSVVVLLQFVCRRQQQIFLRHCIAQVGLDLVVILSIIGLLSTIMSRQTQIMLRYCTTQVSLNYTCKQLAYGLTWPSRQGRRRT